MTKFRVLLGREHVQIEVSPGAPWIGPRDLRVRERPGSHRAVRPDTHARSAQMELDAGKFCAALDGQHPRDLFDVMQFLQAGRIDRALFDVFLVYLLSADRPLRKMSPPVSHR